MKGLTGRRSTIATGATSVEAARARGVSLAVLTAASAIEQAIGAVAPCPPADEDCLNTRYATLLRHRDLVHRASTELARLEHTVAEACGAEASDDLVDHIPNVRVSRQKVDDVHDAVSIALTNVKAGLTRARSEPA